MQMILIWANDKEQPLQSFWYKASDARLTNTQLLRWRYLQAARLHTIKKYVKLGTEWNDTQFRQAKCFKVVENNKKMENGGDQRSLAKCRVCEEYVNIECDKCDIQTAEEKKNISELKKK